MQSKNYTLANTLILIKHEIICPYESKYSFIRDFLRFPKFTMS